MEKSVASSRDSSHPVVLNPNTYYSNPYYSHTILCFGKIVSLRSHTAMSKINPKRMSCIGPRTSGGRETKRNPSRRNTIANVAMATPQLCTSHRKSWPKSGNRRG